MSIEENKELVKKVLASGLDVVEFMAEDAVWVIPGFGTYRGKQDIHANLLAPVENLMETTGSRTLSISLQRGTMWWLSPTRRTE
jgi:hypothetical protein